MNPTKTWVLVVAAVLAAGGGYLLAESAYGRLPAVPLSAAFTLGLIALAVLITAGSVRARMAGRPGTRPISPLLVARYAALAKACALAGALATGGYAGLLAYTFPQRDRLTAAGPDALASGLGVLAGLGLVLAALRLEAACRVPGPPRDRATGGLRHP